MRALPENCSMLDLLRAEWRRYRLPALGVGLAHLLLLIYLTRLLKLPQQSLSFLTLIGAVYMISGMLFGAWQMQGHRRPSSWLSLLHRPISPVRIGAALAGAGSLVMLQTVLLPIVLALPIMIFMGQPIDTLHAGLAVHALLLSLCGYLTGAAALLGPLWRGLPLLPFAPLLLFDYIPLPWLLLPMIAFDLLLLAVLLDRFRPDLAAPPQHLGSRLLQGLPLLIAFAWLLQMLLQILVQGMLALIGTHPSQAPENPEQFEHWRRLNATELWKQALPVLPATWTAAQLDEADHLHVRYPGTSLPQRHQPAAPRAGGLNWSDPKRGWTLLFSHDTMRYRVQDPRGRQLGWLGAGCLTEQAQDTPAFDHPPLLLGGAVGVGNRLWRLQPGNDCLTLAMELPASAGALQALEKQGRAQLLIGTQALLGLDAQGRTQWQLALPQGLGKTEHFTLSRHAQRDDALLAMVEGRHLQPSQPRLRLWHIDGQGRLHALLDRPLKPDFPDWFVWADWLVAPAISTLIGNYKQWLERQFGSAHLLAETPPRSPRVLGIALALSVLSGLLALALSRRRSGGGIGWAFAAVALGPASLGVQALLQDRVRPGPTWSR
jgi:hypothetical protein